MNVSDGFVIWINNPLGQPSLAKFSCSLIYQFVNARTLLRMVLLLQVAELVSNDELHVASEEVVFAAALRWVKHDIDNREDQVSPCSFSYDDELLS